MIDLYLSQEREEDKGQDLRKCIISQMHHNMHHNLMFNYEHPAIMLRNATKSRNSPNGLAKFESHHWSLSVIKCGMPPICIMDFI